MKRLIDFSSRFRILKGGKVSLVVSALLGGATISFASPSGGTVTSGSANISQVGTVTNINQSTQKASINWQSFSIAGNETVNFNQPNSSSITLNRVIGNERSVIDGALNANGQVWLLNSNGVLFGKNASINTAGLLATTAQLSDSDFNAGNYIFKNATANSVINEGTITISDAGSVILASNEVRNDGVIKAVKGKVHLVGADSYSLNLNGNSLVNLKVDKGVLDAMVENSGHIIADGGEIYLTTNAVDELLKGVVNNTGIIEANSIDGLTGHVELFAHGGEVQVGGTITSLEGFVETSGKDFKIDKDSIIKAKTWLIDPTNITVESTGSTTDLTSSSIKASFIENILNGGTGVILQADNDITIKEALNWTQSLFTLRAGNDVNIFATLTPTGTSSLDIGYGYNGTTYGNGTSAVRYGLYTDTAFQGKVDFGARTGTGFLTINGNGYDVVNDLSVFSAKLNSKGATPTYVAMGSNIDDTATGARNVYVVNQIDSATTFDGLGNTLSNLNFDFSAGYTGANWGFIAQNDGNIKNLGVENLIINGGNSVIGSVGFVGSNYGNVFGIKISGTTSVVGAQDIGSITGGVYGGTLKELSLSGNLQVAGTQTGGLMNVGGAVGNLSSAASSTLQYVYSNASLTTDNPSQYITIGGILGATGVNTYTISNLYNAGSITLGDRITSGTSVVNGVTYTGQTANSSGRMGIGGIVGELGAFTSNNSNVVLSDSSFSGTMSVGNLSYDVGGLVGWNHATISNSIFSGTLTTGVSSAYIGGITGYNFHNWGANVPTINGNTIFSGNLIIGANSAMIGGITGINDSGLIDNFISMGSITTNGASLAAGNVRLGGIAGHNLAGTISNGYSTTTFNLTGNTRNPTTDIGTVGSGYIGKLIGMGTLAASVTSKTAVTYAFADQTATSFSGASYTLPTPIYTGGTVTGTSVVKVYNSFGSDVTASATAGTLQTGQYTVKVASLADTTYGLSGNGNTNLTLSIVAPSPSVSSSSSTTTSNTNENVNKVIAAIANTNALTINPPKFDFKPIAVSPATQPIVMASTGNQVKVLSQPIQKQNTTMVTMGELKSNQEVNTPNGNSEIRVPVGDNSVIELVNGGVNLPNGVEQQFFVVADNEN